MPPGEHCECSSELEDKQEMMLMLVALVVAMWDAKSRRPGGCVKVSASRARDGR
jgi:hypothetical protein